MTHAPHLLVLGGINMDLGMRVPRFPRPGESVIGEGFRTVPGGKGSNQAVAAARLGARVTMLGCVGEDDIGNALLDGLRVEGVDITNISRCPGVATGVAMIQLDPAGQNVIAVDPGANLRVDIDQIRQAWAAMPPPDAVVISLETPLLAATTLATLAHGAGVRVILNPAPIPDDPMPRELLSSTSILIPNETELELMTGTASMSIDEAESAARALLVHGCQGVVLTLGGQGALLVEPRSKSRHIPAIPVDPVDTVAAGDCFVAALTLLLCEGASLDDAAHFAAAAAAISVTRAGAQPSLPQRTEVEKMLNQHDV
jgi:ribokinase